MLDVFYNWVALPAWIIIGAILYNEFSVILVLITSPWMAPIKHSISRKSPHHINEALDVILLTYCLVTACACFLWIAFWVHANLSLSVVMANVPSPDRLISFIHSFIHSFIGICRMWWFLDILRSFFHSSLLCTLSQNGSVMWKYMISNQIFSMKMKICKPLHSYPTVTY